MTYRGRAAVAAVVLGLALFGCSDDSSDDAETDDTTPTTEATADSTAPADETDTSETTSVGTDDTEPTTETTGGGEATTEEMEAALTELLVTPADVGSGFVEDTYEVGSGGPCGIDPDETYPPDLRVGRALLDEEASLAMLHELRVYDSEETAASAFETGIEAISCGTSPDDPSITISEPQDVTTELGTDAVAASITSPDVEGVIVIAWYSDLISVYQFQGAPGAAEAAGAANPLDIASANTAYIMDTIG